MLNNSEMKVGIIKPSVVNFYLNTKQKLIQELDVIIDKPATLNFSEAKNLNSCLCMRGMDSCT